MELKQKVRKWTGDLITGVYFNRKFLPIFDPTEGGVGSWWFKDQIEDKSSVISIDGSYYIMDVATIDHQLNWNHKLSVHQIEPGCTVGSSGVSIDLKGRLDISGTLIDKFSGEIIKKGDSVFTKWTREDNQARPDFWPD